MLEIEAGIDREWARKHNQAPHFSMTATAHKKTKRGAWIADSWGCNHEAIETVAPDLAAFLPWHLVSEPGIPMHYVENTIYHLGLTRYVDKFDPDLARSTCLYGEISEARPNPIADWGSYTIAVETSDGPANVTVGREDADARPAAMPEGPGAQAVARHARAWLESRRPALQEAFASVMARFDALPSDPRNLPHEAQVTLEGYSNGAEAWIASEAAAGRKVTIGAEWFQPDDWQGDGWHCAISRIASDGKRRQIRTGYHLGSGHKRREPTVAEVLHSLAMDAWSVADSGGFDEWCSDLGYDSDSRKAKRMYRACESTIAKLAAFVAPDDWRELAEGD